MGSLVRSIAARCAALVTAASAPIRAAAVLLAVLPVMAAMSGHAQAQAIVNVAATVGVPVNLTPGWPGAPPYTGVGIAGGTLAPGLAVSNTGVLTGTPTTVGVFNANYEGNNGGGGFAATLRVTVSAQSVPAIPAPTTAPGQIRTNINTAGSIDVGTLLTGSISSIRINSGPSNGSAAAGGNVLTYTPAAGFVGSDSFTYQATGPGGASNISTISVTVVQSTPAPGAGSLSVNVPFNSPGFVIDLTGSVSGSVTAVAVVAAPGKGTVTVSGLKATYVPTANASGADSFTYRATGPGGTSAAATVSISVGLPDPTKDPDTVSLIGAEGDQVNHFADLQLDTYNQHLEGLHDGSVGQGPGVGFNFASSAAGPAMDVATRTDPRSASASDLLTAASWRYAGGPQAEAAAVVPAGPRLGATASAAAGQPYGFWASGGVNFGNRRSQATRSRTRYTTVGLSAGVDYRLSDDLTLGAGGGYNQDDAKVGSAGSRAKGKGYFGIAYASYRPQPKLYIDGMAGYGTLKFDSQRRVASGLFAAGSRGGDAMFGSVTLGGDLMHGAVAWSPYARLDGLSGTIDSFTETGGGVYNLTYASQKVSSSVVTLGVRASKAMAVSEGTFTPRARVELLQALSNRDRVSMTYAAFTGSPVFTLSERLQDRTQVQVGLGGALKLKGGMSLDAEYRGAVVFKDQRSNQLVVGLRLPF